MKRYQRKDILMEGQREYLKGRNKIRLKNIILNESMTINEIVKTLKKQKKGKAPGPDGLPTEYYKTSEDSIPFK